MFPHVLLKKKTKKTRKQQNKKSILLCLKIMTTRNLGIFRAVMTDGEKIGATRLVLEPVSLAVYLARSLSPWYHEIPDVDVMGKLHAVKVSSEIDDREAHQHVVHGT